MNYNQLIEKKFSNVDNFDNLHSFYYEFSIRMLNRLNFIKINPGLILELGSGVGADSKVLNEKFPNATITALDIASKLLKIQPKYLLKMCASATAIPVNAGVIDLVWSNLLLPYISNYQLFFQEIKRVLKKDGLLLISGLSYDSLKELRKIGLNTANFPDMHVVGDLLLELGFKDPVLDLEVITLKYDSFKDLLFEIHSIGCGANFATNEIKLSKQLYFDLERRYLQMVGNEFLLTLEVFYIHAWNQDNNREIIKFYR